MNIKIIDLIKKAQATADGCLPLAGGTMTGQLTAVSGLRVLAENSINEGGQIELLPSVDSDQSHRTIIDNIDSQETRIFSHYNGTAGIGTMLQLNHKSGYMAWDGRSIVRSINGIYADSGGNVAMYPVPNYYAGISSFPFNTDESGGNIYVAPYSGVAYVEYRTNADQVICYYINNLGRRTLQFSGVGQKNSLSTFILNKGDSIKFVTSPIIECAFTFFPFKGGA